MGRQTRRRRARERWGVTCARRGRRRAQGSLTPGSGRETKVSPGRGEPGRGRRDRRVHPAGAVGVGGLGRSLTVRRWRQCSWRPQPSSCGAAHRPGSAAPRPVSAPPGPAGRPPARSRPPCAATSHGTCPEPDAPRTAGSEGAAVGARFRCAATGDPGGRRTSARAGREAGGSGRPKYRVQRGWAGRRQWLCRDRERPGG